MLSISASAQENGKDAVVALPNLNVLYFGIPNPVQIAVPGVASDKVTATITNGSISKTSNGWEVKPSTANGTVIINVLVNNQKVSEKTFRVKSIPAPVAVLAGKGNGVISKNDALNAGEIVTEMKNFLWDLKYEIKSYSFLYSVNGNDKLISTTGNKLTEEMKSIISNLRAGENIIFKDIKALSPDSRIYDINPLILQLN
jgi:phosphosulfolactate phosphohydrolase-like enzyme